MEQGSQDQAGADRPDVLASLSTTQIDELARQFSEGDHKEWTEITDSYGWSAEQSEAVWQWFGREPVAGHPAPREEGFPGEGR